MEPFTGCCISRVGCDPAGLRDQRPKPARDAPALHGRNQGTFGRFQIGTVIDLLWTALWNLATSLEDTG